jgi:protein-disulfide isomerase
MASRTKQKEQARARRLAEERARADRHRRDRRLRMIGGIVLAAIAVIGVAIAISSGGGGSSSGLKTGTQQAQVTGQVSQLLSGIPQAGTTLGNKNAPVTMTYYGDFECPVCRDFTLSGGFPQLVANDVRSGKVKVVFRAFQTATPSPQTFLTQQVAGLAAGKQNKFWDYMELFYRQQGTEGTAYATDGYLTKLAQQVPGLNVSQWRSARQDPALASQVQGDASSANNLGVNATPTLIFQGPKGQAAIANLVDYSTLQKEISKVS